MLMSKSNPNGTQTIIYSDNCNNFPIIRPKTLQMLYTSRLLIVTTSRHIKKVIKPRFAEANIILTANGKRRKRHAPSIKELQASNMLVGVTCSVVMAQMYGNFF